MIRSIAYKEFFNNLVSTRFIIGFTLCIVLIPLSLFVSINDYTSKQRAYTVQKKQAEEAFEVRVYSNLRPKIAIPPEDMSIFSRGINYNIGNRIEILLQKKPILPIGKIEVHDNQLLTRFFSIDFISVIAIILSLLSILFTYDLCTREKEEGTFKLMFSNSVGRSTILLGKLLGTFMTLLPILLFSFILSIIVVLLSTNISYSGDEWIRIGLLFLMCIFYVIFFMLLGLLISTRSKSSVRSIILSISIWFILVFVIPNVAIYSALSFVKVESHENIQIAMDALNLEYNKEHDEYWEKIVTPDVWFSHWNHNGGPDGYREVAGTADKTFEFYRKLNAYCEPLRVEYAEKKWPIQKAYLDQLYKQKKLAETLSLFSPSEVLRLTGATLCRTNTDAYLNLFDQVLRYRDEFIRYYTDNKIFESFNYFTRVPPEKFMTADEMIQITTNGRFKTREEIEAWEKTTNDVNSVFTGDLPDYYSENNYYDFLDVSDVPRFVPASPRVTDDFIHAITKMAAIILASIVMFYLAYVSFIRYDVR
jgi:ABC-type transport system involved in multi-copper enzyme maturation permease subunit